MWSMASGPMLKLCVGAHALICSSRRDITVVVFSVTDSKPDTTLSLSRTHCRSLSINMWRCIDSPSVYTQRLITAWRHVIVWSSWQGLFYTQGRSSPKCNWQVTAEQTKYDCVSERSGWKEQQIRPTMRVKERGQAQLDFPANMQSGNRKARTPTDMSTNGN